MNQHNDNDKQSNAAHPVVSGEQWLSARLSLLAREKELTRLHDQIARERRALPWQRVTKEYVFDTPTGRRTLADLFDGRRQLLVQHIMFGPGWPQACPSCSFMADHSDGMAVHLQQRDITLVAVSRAALADIADFRRRMGWQFGWVSAHDSDFNQDFKVSFDPQQQASGEVDYNYCKQFFPSEEAPGISVFYQDEAGAVFHTYSTYGRGVEVMLGAYQLIDLTPIGRNENHLPDKMDWVRHHDRYAAQKTGAAVASPACCHAQDAQT